MNLSTEAEIQHHCKTQLFSLGNNIAKNVLSIEEVGDYIPGSVMVQDLSIMTNTYMNQFGCDILKHSSEELYNLGPEYFSRFFPQEEIKILSKELQQFIQQGDQQKVHSFFQRVRPDSSEDYSWYFTSSRLYPSENIESPLKIIHVAIEASMLSYAGKKLSNLVEHDAFIRKHYHLYNLLSVREKQIIRLIVEGQSSIQIADSLFLSIHTVNNHRKNILHKLELNCISQLIKFAVAFDII